MPVTHKDTRSLNTETWCLCIEGPGLLFYTMIS